MHIITKFNPFSSNYHAVSDFKKLKPCKKIATILFTLLATIASIPLLGLGGVATFRSLTEKFSIKPDLQPDTAAAVTAVKTEEVASNHLTITVPTPETIPAPVIEPVPEAPKNTTEVIVQQKIKAPSSRRLLIPFYEGNGVDTEGRSIEMILAFDYKKKESQHDYIQWLFPTRTPSRFNPKAPLLNDRLITKMKHNPIIINNLQRAFCSMMDFYGLKYDPATNTMTPVEIKDLRGKWFKPSDHNMSRLTRILDCFMTLGLEDEAKALYGELKRLTDKGRLAGFKNSYGFWRQIIKSEQTKNIS